MKIEEKWKLDKEKKIVRREKKKKKYEKRKKKKIKKESKKYCIKKFYIKIQNYRFRRLCRKLLVKFCRNLQILIIHIKKKSREKIVKTIQVGSEAQRMYIIMKESKCIHYTSSEWVSE